MIAMQLLTGPHGAAVGPHKTQDFALPASSRVQCQSLPLKCKSLGYMMCDVWAKPVSVLFSGLNDVSALSAMKESHLSCLLDCERCRKIAGESQGEEGRGSTLKRRVVIAETPLMRMLMMLRSDPPRCGFQLEPDQVSNFTCRQNPCISPFS